MSRPQTLPEQIETRMLSGEPFTYGGLASAFEGQGPGDVSRLVDRTIQKLRKKGLIAFKRQGRDVIWQRVLEEAS